MSIALTFDTLAYVKRLRDADVPEKQAEAQADALRVALDGALSEHSKVQLQETVRAVDALDTKTEKAIANLDAKIDLVRKDMAMLEQRSQSRFTLLQWMLGFLLGGVLSLIAGVLLLVLRTF